METQPVPAAPPAPTYAPPVAPVAEGKPENPFGKAWPYVLFGAGIIVVGLTVINLIYQIKLARMKIAETRETAEVPEQQ